MTAAGQFNFRLAKDEIVPTMSSALKALLFSVVNLVAAACVYAHLITGGWRPAINSTVRPTSLKEWALRKE